MAGPSYIQDICMIFNVPCSAGYVQGTIMWWVLVKYRICAGYFIVSCSAGYVQGTIMWWVLVKHRICA